MKRPETRERRPRPQTILCEFKLPSGRICGKPSRGAKDCCDKHVVELRPYAREVVLEIARLKRKYGKQWDL